MAILGQIQYVPTEAEKKARLRRRSLYIGEDIKASDILTTKNLRRIHPGPGLPPKFFDVLLGKKVNQNVKKGTPVSWDLFD